jgi:hypothetical protein
MFELEFREEFLPIYMHGLYAKMFHESTLTV